ncbi:acyltransferase [Clostridium malenominatum]|uniref:Acyltransferase n=1 Tax=Clostridium malenominatum TaxID=1539 RepID=A0ABP3UAZ8_9CLOT
MAKYNFTEIDMGKAYATFAVVMIHISAFVIGAATKGSQSYKVAIILNQLSRFSVPLFIIFSGLGLGLSYKKDKNLLRFYKKRLLKVIPPYILWGIIYLTIINKNFNYNSWLELFLKGDKIFYHLYFLPLIIELYLFFPVLYIVSKKIWGVILALILSGGVITSAHYFNIPNLSLDFYSKRNPIFWLFYFCLGIYLSENIKKYREKFKCHKALISCILLICLSGILIETFISIKVGKSLDYATTFIRPSIIIYSIIFTIYILSRDFSQGRLFKFLKNISINSFAIYFAHPLIIYYYIKIFKGYKISIGSLEFLISSFIISIIIPLIISMIFNKIKRKIKL